MSDGHLRVIHETFRALTRACGEVEVHEGDCAMCLDARAVESTLRPWPCEEGGRLQQAVVDAWGPVNDVAGLVTDLMDKLDLDAVAYCAGVDEEDLPDA